MAIVPEHLRLRFGPYAMPEFEYGDIVTDELRGDVRIISLTDAPIQWPKGRRVGQKGGGTAIVLYDALVDAVRRESNQCIARWWGVSGQTVTKWRRALDVLRTEGDHQRMVEVGHAAYPRAKPALLATSSDPGRRQKIAESKRGKKRPQHVIEAMRKANAGRQITDETRQKMSDAQRRRGVRPPAAGIAWTVGEDEWCRTLPIAEVVKRTGRTLSAVRSRRSQLSLPDARKRAGAGRQAALYEHCAGIVPQLVEMREAGHSMQKIANWLNSARVPNKRRPDWNRRQVQRLLAWYQQISLHGTAYRT